MWGKLPRVILYSGVCALALLAVSTFGAATAHAAERGAVCADCHEGTVAQFNLSFHARIWQGANECQVCHGEIDQHVDDPSKKNVVSFNREGGRAAAELTASCLGCHAASANLALWDMGKHQKNDVTCVACHTIHRPQMAVQQPQVCEECHKDIKMQINKRSHHPIIEGKVGCSDCHDTHGTLSHNMIRSDNVNQLCYKCHADKRGPYIFEHPPVEENCVICHNPHGTRHENLLVQKLPNLCQDCHDYSRHPGTPYDANNAFTASSPSSRFYGRSCLNCHGAIHGSVNFGLQKLTR